MSTIIGTDANGYVTYVNQPEVNRTLSKNIKDVFPESELEEIFSELNGVNVAEDLTITPGTNCAEAEVINAVKYGKILFLQFTAKPSVTLNSGSNLYVDITGITPKLTPTWRTAFSSAGNDVFMAWVSAVNTETDTTTFLCRRLGTTTWTTDSNIKFSGIIPIE